MLKKDKKFEKLLIQEFEKEYECKIDIEEIEGIELEPKTNYSPMFGFYKLNKLFSCLLILVSIISVTGIVLWVNSGDNNLTDQKVISETNLAYIMDICDEGFDTIAKFRLKVSNTTILYIFEGHRNVAYNRDLVEKIYIGIFINIGSLDQATLTTPNSEYKVTDENNLCILANYFVEKNDDELKILEFTVKMHKRERNFLLTI